MIDGLLLIIAHATVSPLGEGVMYYETNAFYRHVYVSKYVYGVWLIEVSIDKQSWRLSVLSGVMMSACVTDLLLGVPMHRL